jgi:hypothetical protein
LKARFRKDADAAMGSEEFVSIKKAENRGNMGRAIP